MLSSVNSFTVTSINGTCTILDKPVTLTVHDNNINASIPLDENGSLSISLDVATKRSNINISNLTLTPEVIEIVGALNSKFEEILLDIV